MTLPGILRTAVQKLEPSVFALVMSTGIVSIAAHLWHYERISQFLFFLNGVQFVVLAICMLLRAVLFFPEIVEDLTQPAKGAGFLTLVAGSCLLGMQCVLLGQNDSAAVVLFFAALVLWLLIMYSFFIAIITKEEKPALETGMNGSWLLIVVSTQSLSILASTIRQELPFPVQLTAFFSLAAFLVGFVLYIIIITLVLYRLLFFRLSAGEFTPSYWIDMGACAITTLAAATFAATNQEDALFRDFIPVVKTGAVLSWGISTWWIPIITRLEIWRHISKKFPLRYNAGYWSMVFPLGMYSVCTYRMAQGLGFYFLGPISRVYLFVSLAVWAVTFGAMGVKLVKQSFQGVSPPGGG